MKIMSVRLIYFMQYGTPEICCLLLLLAKDGDSGQ